MNHLLLSSIIIRTIAYVVNRIMLHFFSKIRICAILTEIRMHICVCFLKKYIDSKRKNAYNNNRSKRKCAHAKKRLNTQEGVNGNG